MPARPAVWPRLYADSTPNAMRDVGAHPALTRAVLGARIGPMTPAISIPSRIFREGAR